MNTATGSSPSLPPGVVVDGGVQLIQVPMELSNQERSAGDQESASAAGQ